MLENSNYSGKKEVAELVDENISLNRKNRLLCMGVIALSAISAVCGYSDRKSTNALAGMRSENTALKAKVAYCQKNATTLASENNELKSYKEFVDSIELFRPETSDCRTDAEEKEVEQKNIAAHKKYNDACRTLNIDPVKLRHLKERE